MQLENLILRNMSKSISNGFFEDTTKCLPYGFIWACSGRFPFNISILMDSSAGKSGIIIFVVFTTVAIPRYLSIIALRISIDLSLFKWNSPISSLFISSSKSRSSLSMKANISLSSSLFETIEIDPLTVLIGVASAV